MSIAKLFSLIRPRKSVHEEIVASQLPMSMADYVAQLGDMPIPTEAQMKAFAIHVAHAHSWYKHLPFAQPGKPFHLFLGHPDSSLPPHYSRHPEEQHLQQFGCLDYATYDEDASEGANSNPVLARLPPEILEAGKVSLTAFVHTNTSGQGLFVWEDQLHKMPFERIGWPDQSGGRDVWEKIRECVRYLRKRNKQSAESSDSLSSPYPLTKDDFERLQRDHPFIALWRPEMLLYQFTVREQDRQINEMVAAMSRVCRLVEVWRIKGALA